MQGIAQHNGALSATNSPQLKYSQAYEPLLKAQSNARGQTM
jgi:hypothetical protein